MGRVTAEGDELLVGSSVAKAVTLVVALGAIRADLENGGWPGADDAIGARRCIALRRRRGHVIANAHVVGKPCRQVGKEGRADRKRGTAKHQHQ